MSVMTKYVILNPTDVKCIIYVFNEIMKAHKPQGNGFDFSTERHVNLLVDWLAEEGKSGRRNTLKDLSKCAWLLLNGYVDAFNMGKRKFARFVLDDIADYFGYATWPYLVKQLEQKVEIEVSFPKKQVGPAEIPKLQLVVMVIDKLNSTTKSLVRGDISKAESYLEQSLKLLRERGIER